MTDCSLIDYDIDLVEETKFTEFGFVGFHLKCFGGCDVDVFVTLPLT